MYLRNYVYHLCVFPFLFPVQTGFLNLLRTVKRILKENWSCDIYWMLDFEILTTEEHLIVCRERLSKNNKLF